MKNNYFFRKTISSFLLFVSLSLIMIFIFSGNEIKAESPCDSSWQCMDWGLGQDCTLWTPGRENCSITPEQECELSGQFCEPE